MRIFQEICNSKINKEIEWERVTKILKQRNYKYNYIVPDIWMAEKSVQRSEKEKIIYIYNGHKE